MLRIDELTDEERAVYATLKPERLPQHVAIIMDGNGRWAGHRSLKRFLGHQQGANSVQLVTETASRIGLPWLTLYAFSLENNLRRPRAEVNFLMRLLKTYLESNLQRMMDNNVRMRYIGRTHELPAEVQEKMRWAEEATAAQHRNHPHPGPQLRRPLRAGGRLPRPGRRDEAKTPQPCPHHRGRHSPPSLHRAHARPRPADPHLGRDAPVELPALADRLHRDLRHRAPAGQTSAASICWKPSQTSSSASAATAASAKRTAKWKRTPIKSRSWPVEVWLSPR